MRKLSLAALFALALVLSFATRDRAAETKVEGLVHLTCNTEANEDDPHVSTDGRLLFYSSDAKGKYDIMVSARPNTRQAWPDGRVYGDYVETKVDDRSAFAVDLRLPQFLYFATKGDKEGKNFDLYVAVRNTPRSVFSSPTPLNTIDTEADEMHPWLTTSGRQIYFSRKTKDGWRVLVASRQTSTGAAGFGEPRLIEELPAGFHHATLTPDGKTAYLQGPVESKRWGLFVSTLKGGKWSKPEALALNCKDTPVGDTSPNLSRDGRMLYFASDRPGGKGKMDLYVIPVFRIKKAE